MRSTRRSQLFDGRSFEASTPTSSANTTVGTRSTAITSLTTNGNDDPSVRPPIRDISSRRSRARRVVHIDRVRHHDPPVRLRLREPGRAAVAPHSVEAYLRWRQHFYFSIRRELELSVPVSLLD